MAASPSKLTVVYLQDVIQLSGRDLFDRCRCVSNRFNRMLNTTAEAHLPRRRFDVYIQCDYTDVSAVESNFLSFRSAFSRDTVSHNGVPKAVSCIRTRDCKQAGTNGTI